MNKESNENILEMLEIYKLLEFDFFIPSYQRGYRWTKKQVKALLDDIWEFRNKSPKVDEYYCLQPIVVTQNRESDIVQWELIDGQQRLTTIYIILNYFNSRYTEENRNPIFSLHYKTREDSKTYLKHITKAEKDANIDYHFIYEASETVREWFKSKSNFINDFESILLNKTKIIWYEVKDLTTNPIDIFTRINIGKIPLTNSELVKALFLQKINFTSDKTIKQIRIASEWDEIEKKLQDDSFWYFIYNPKASVVYENRIEYIFDLLQEKHKEYEEYYTFYKFNTQFEDEKSKNEGKVNVEDQWLKVKKYFLTLEEWFNDRELYHLIGFLIEDNYDINKLKSASSESKKSEFIIFLKSQIRDKLRAVQLDTLDYYQHPKLIKKTLLLFNIQTILSTQKAEIRFPFDKYKNENWDIEHVNSQTEQTIDKSSRKEWAVDILEYFTGETGYSVSFKTDSGQTQREIQVEIIESFETLKKDFCVRLLKILDSDKPDDKHFERLYDDLLVNFKEKQFEQNDSISNLALLDENTNRGYGNAMFPIKRKRIIENDRNGVFVPICTKNLFLKYYSKQMGDVMYWQKSDGDDYLKAMKKVLKEYLPIQN